MIEKFTGYHTVQGNGKTSGRVFYRLYTPLNSEACASVLIIHGMQEHSGRYADLAVFLAGAGFSVLVYDQPGHGFTAESDFDQGFFRKEEPVLLLLDTATRMQELLVEKNPHKPCFVIGHSMGSFVTRALLQTRSDSFAGAVLVGTGGYRLEMQILKKVFSYSNSLQPRSRTWFNKLFLAANDRRFRNEPGRAFDHWLSKNEANRQAFQNDKLCGIPFTNNGFFTLFSVYTLATRAGWADSVRRQLPMAFLSGQDDPVGQFGQGVRQTVAELERLDFCDISVQLYPSMRHEILNESIRLTVYEYLLNWLNNRL